MTLPIEASWKNTRLHVASDTYTGNGATTGREIDIGFQPSFLFIQKAGNQDSYVTVSTTNAGHLDEDGTNEANNITDVHLSTNGFTVGDGSDEGNDNGVTFYYMAFKLAGSFFASWKDTPYRLTTGSYTGDGTTSGREITPTGGKPDWVFIQETGTSVGFWATADTTSALAVVPGLSNRVQEHTGVKLSTNGFTVGDGNADAANADTTVHKYAAVYLSGYNLLAWKDSDHEIEQGSYTGDGASSRTISLSMTADHFFIKEASSAQTWYGNGNNTGSMVLSPSLLDEVQITVDVKGTTDGIVVDGANTNSTVYNYLAIRTG